VGAPASGLVWFFDRSMGGRDVPDAFAARREHVRRHHVVFPRAHLKREKDDLEWIGRVGVEGWVGITEDKRLLENVLAHRDVKRYRAQVFVLMSGDLDTRAQVKAVVRALPQMAAIVNARRRPGERVPFFGMIYKDRGRAPRFHNEWPWLPLHPA
jgi:hypothetical protein